MILIINLFEFNNYSFYIKIIIEITSPLPKRNLLNASQTSLGLDRTIFFSGFFLKRSGTASPDSDSDHAVFHFLLLQILLQFYFVTIFLLQLFCFSFFVVCYKFCCYNFILLHFFVTTFLFDIF